MPENMKGLTAFIGDIRNAKVRELEEKRINKEMANIRQKFKEGGLNGYQKKKYVCKLLYMSILGVRLDFGHMEALNLVSSTKYSEKRIGYLAVTMLMNENSDLVRLVVNSIKKDLDDSNEIANCLALDAIANVGGREMAEALVEDVHRALVSPTSEKSVRKKAALTLLRLYRKHPDIVNAQEWALRIVALLDHQDLAVCQAVVSLITVLAQDDLQTFSTCYVKAIDRLSKIVLHGDYPKDYIYYKVPVPWLQVKLLRLLQYYPPTQNQTLISLLDKTLNAILDNSQNSPKNVQHNNAQNAVLFEAINLAIHLDASSKLVSRASSLLARFIQAKETNVRYLGLDTMAHLAVYPATLEHLKKHEKIILHSLRDKDISVRRRALDLLYSMCDSTNAKTIVGEMMKYLQVADYALREDLALKLAILTEKYAVDYEWYLDSNLQLMSTAGDHVSDEVWQRLIQIVTNNEELQPYAARTILQIVQAPSCHENLVKLAGYILGEFGHLIANEPGMGAQDQLLALQAKHGQCSHSTRALLLSTYFKFTNLFPELIEPVSTVLDHHRHVFDVELQQRACEYLNIIRLPNHDLLQTICEEMPPFPAKDSNLLNRLNKKHLGSHDQRTWQIGGRDANLATVAKRLRGMSLDAADGQTSQREVKPVSLLDTMEDTAETPDISRDTEPQGMEHVNGVSIDNHENVNGEARSVSAKTMATTIIHDPLDTAPSTAPITEVSRPLPEAANDMDSSSPISDQWFSKLCYVTEGVVYEDLQLQVGLKSEYSQGRGQLALYYGNKISVGITSFTTSSSGVTAEQLDMTSSEIPPNNIHAHEQIKQVFMLECLRPFTTAPILQVSYLAGSHQTIRIKLPTVLTKFLQPVTIGRDDFFSRWQQISGEDRECQIVFDAKATKSSRERDQKIIAGFNFGLCKEVDTNPMNVVGAAVLHTKDSGRVGSLLRLEPNPALKKYRLTIRTTQPAVSAELLRLVRQPF